MKSVLISIQPKWCELITSGKKTIEVRKTRPKLETPFKCYIYCTKSKEVMFTVFLNEPDREVEYLSGKVIGEFVCDFIDETYPIHVPQINKTIYTDEWVKGSRAENACLSIEEISEYGKGKPLYGWHISNLKFYDKPKELGEFFVKGECENLDFCRFCSNFHEGRGWLDGSTCDEDDCITFGIKPIRRPPQSWCYVEE